MLIDEVFKNNKVLIPYLTFGDPNIEDTDAYVRACLDNGADIIELGMPFSDPIADGPVIQASHQRALTQNPRISFDDLFQFTKQIKQEYSKPVITMASVTLVENYGIESFFKNAQAAQLDGIIIPDLLVDDVEVFQQFANHYSVALIMLVSPLTPKDRLVKISQACSGFVYLMSSVGITGERDSFANELNQLAQDIKSVKDIPVVIGFGISSPEQLREVYEYSDGAIVGSHLIKRLQESSDSTQRIADLSKRIKQLKLL